jgi:hypothetical protein
VKDVATGAGVDPMVDGGDSELAYLVVGLTPIGQDRIACSR